MSRTTGLLLALCCLLAVSQASAARLLGEEEAATSEAWREGETVEIGVFTDDFPWAYVEDGELKGLDPGLAKAVCGHAGLECELVPIDKLEERIPSLQNGTVDALFASLAVNAERAELIDFLHPFYYAYDLSLVALESEAAELEAAGGFSGIKGKKLCVETGNAAIKTVAKFSPVVVEAASSDDIIDKLVAGDCIATVDSNFGLRLKKSALERHNAKLVDLGRTETVAPGAAAAAVAKGQAGSELGLRLTAGLVAAMSKGKESDLLALEEEFMLANDIPKNEVLHSLVELLTDLGTGVSGDKEARRRLLGEEEAATSEAWREGETVKIGVFTDDFPWAYVEDGELKGFGPGLAKAVCGHASLECELVPIDKLEERIPSLQNGTVDALFASLAVNAERAELIDFLHPFYDAYDLSLVALESEAAELEAAGGFSGIKGKKLCVETGDAAMQTVAKFGPVVVEAASRDDIVDKIIAGDCIASVDGSVGLDLKKSALERHNVKLVVLPKTEAVAPGTGAAAVAKGQGGSELGLRLTAGLVAAMSQGEESDLLALEEEFVLANDIPKNEALHSLVEMLTDLGTGVSGGGEKKA